MTDGSPGPARRSIAPPSVLGDPERLRALADTGLDAVPDEAFDRFARLVSDLLDVPVALVSLVSADRQFFPGAVGLPDPWSERRQTPLSHSFCQHVVDIEAPMVLPDARLYPRVRDNLAIDDLGVVAYAGMPLTDLSGRVLGSLCAIDNKPRAWTAAQLRTLADLAAACSSELRLRIALDGAQEARRRVVQAHERLELVAGVSETLAGTLDVGTALRRLAATMVPLLADWCLLTLIGPTGLPREVVSVHRDPARAADVDRFGDLLRTGLSPESIIRAVLRTGQPRLGSVASLADVTRGTTHPEMAPSPSRSGHRLLPERADAGRRRHGAGRDHPRQRRPTSAVRRPRTCSPLSTSAAGPARPSATARCTASSGTSPRCCNTACCPGCRWWPSWSWRPATSRRPTGWRSAATGTTPSSSPTAT